MDYVQMTVICIAAGEIPPDGSFGGQGLSPAAANTNR
jgi:hypothetical protein